MLQTLTADALAQFVTALDPDTKETLALIALRGQPLSKRALYEALNYTRFRGDKAMTKLETLGLVKWTELGPAKAYSLTLDGIRAADTLKNATAN